MKKIKVTTNFKNFPLKRQTPNERSVWQDYKFFINDKEVKNCDYWVVFEGLNEKEEAVCKEGGKIFIAAEPCAVKTYNESFLKQFDHIVTSQKQVPHPGAIYDQQSLPWFVGWKYDFDKGKWAEDYSKTYDELKDIDFIEKPKLASVICSDKAGTPGQRKRLRFLKKLKKRLGDKIDFFGRGFQPVSDKWDAIAPYKYHICLENTATDDYWTEKLSDAFLSLSYPVYWGCTNIDDYFPDDSYSYIDINNLDKAIQQVENILDSGLYEESFEEIKRAKSLVLDIYNFFPHVVDLIEKKIKTTETRKKYYLHPEYKSLLSIFSRAFRSKAWNIYTKLSQLK